MKIAKENMGLSFHVVIQPINYGNAMIVKIYGDFILHLWPHSKCYNTEFFILCMQWFSKITLIRSIIKPGPLICAIAGFNCICTHNYNSNHRLFPYLLLLLQCEMDGFATRYSPEISDTRFTSRLSPIRLNYRGRRRRRRWRSKVNAWEYAVSLFC